MSDRDALFQALLAAPGLARRPTAPNRFRSCSGQRRASRRQPDVSGSGRTPLPLAGHVGL